MQTTLLPWYKHLLLSLTFFSYIAFSVKAQKPSDYRPVLFNEIPVMMKNIPDNPKPEIIAPARIKVKSAFRNTENLCGVTASFTPGIDSFFSVPTRIIFVSTSINASSLQWQVNGLNYPQGTTLDFFFTTAGSYEVSLTARNGNCTDVFAVTIVFSGIPPAGNEFFSGSIGFNNHAESGTAIAHTADSGFIIGGSTTINGGQSFNPNSLLIKMKTGGCIEWSRQIKHQAEFTHNVSQLLGLRDSGYLLSGHLGQSSYLMRMDKTGGQQWAKQFSTISTIYGGYRQLYEMNDGSIVGTTSPFGNVLNIGKMDASGQPIWTKHLQKDLFASTYITTAAIFEWKTALYVLGSLKLPDVFPNTGPFTSFLLKLNPTDGTVIWTKLFESPDPSRSIYSKDIQVHGDRLLISSIHFNTLGGFTVRPLLHWIDSSGTIVAAKSITQNLQLDFPTGVKAGVLPGGNIMLYFRGRENINIQPGYFIHAYYMKLGGDTNIITIRQTGGGTSLNSSYDPYTAMNFNGSAISNVGTALSSPLVPWISHSQNMAFQYRDSAMLDYGCSYNNTAFSVNNISMQSLPFTWLIDSLFTTAGSPVPLQLNDVYPQIKSSCPDYIDSCAILKVRGQQSICNLNSVYTYKAAKNNKCPRPVEWTYQGSLTVVSQTDSSISVRFNSFGNHTIIAKLRNSCNPVLDSISIVAGNSSPVLNLGPDQALCAGNSITLHASPHYLLYSWNTGGTDSLLTVNAPGLYWVAVTDSCGNILRDSIIITPAPPVSLSIGPDRTKCNNDTLQLHAPPGFLNYTWGNNYNINTLQGQSVIVNPLVDTIYFVKGEKTPGCFGYDTVRINVSNSAPVSLGPDTSICSGNTLTLNAGTGFSSYIWNTGATSSQLTINTAGLYFVTAIAATGCKSYDTLELISVHPLPVVSLNKNTGLCKGETRILNAGQHASYLWHNGSTQATFPVQTTGMYFVEVSDVNGCKNSDTARITRMDDLPSGFLPASMEICNYGNSLLQPTRSFASYQWNTGSQSKSVSISNPGTYWLRVIDMNGCAGADSILVTLKQCLQGLFVPTAFTPNNDGRNDVLIPFLYGNVLSYYFTIYNRWGQPVFLSAKPGEGWNGMVKGIPTDGNVFVWQCIYQLQGEVKKQASGTITLIR